MLKKILIIFFLFMNIYNFVTVRTDKNLAINGAYRTAEVRLVALSSLGAVPGTMLGFKVFNHKTNQNNKGYLWDALYIVLAENVLLYAAVFGRKVPKRGGRKTLLFDRRNPGKD